VTFVIDDFSFPAKLRDHGTLGGIEAFFVTPLISRCAGLKLSRLWERLRVFQ
jgi:hypothetical protein